MSIPTFQVGTFSFPDTPEARRVADQHKLQDARRSAVHSTLSAPPIVRNIGFNSPVQNPNDPSLRRTLFTSPFNDSSNVQTETPVTIQFLEVGDPDLSSENYSALAIQSMLNGTAQLIKYSSANVINFLMGTSAVPPLVADQKKNKAATVSGFIAQIKKLTPEIILPTTQKHHELRSTVSTAVIEIGKEYKTSKFPIFASQMIIAMLLQMQNPQKIINQIHRFLGCADDTEMQLFGDYCALGKAAPNEIDFSVPAPQLTGYRILVSSPSEWMQLATFILDYACFMSSSDLLQEYQKSKTILSQLSLNDFETIQEFSDQEIALYHDHEIAAASAIRSVIDPVDRANLILSRLNNDLQIKINKRGRKDLLPENCKDRNWLIQVLITLEMIEDPVFIQYMSSAEACKHFLKGKCIRDNCRYKHIASDPSQPPSQQIPSAAPKPLVAIKIASAKPNQAKVEDLNAPDVVDILCRSMLSPGCKHNFKASPSFWAGFTDKDGNPYSTPKSCDVCRQFKRDTEYITPTSMVTADVPAPVIDDEANFSFVAAATEFGLADSGPHENDGVDDFYCGYDLSMTDAQAP